MFDGGFAVNGNATQRKKKKNRMSTTFEFFRYHGLSQYTEPTIKAMHQGCAVTKSDELLSGCFQRDGIHEDFTRRGYITAQIDNSCQVFKKKKKKKNFFFFLVALPHPTQLTNPQPTTKKTGAW